MIYDTDYSTKVFLPKVQRYLPYIYKFDSVNIDKTRVQNFCICTTFICGA